MPYAELRAHPGFSFLAGTRLRARDLACHALALTDHYALDGAMKFARYARA